MGYDISEKKTSETDIKSDNISDIKPKSQEVEPARIETPYSSASDYSDRVGAALEQKEYQHWNSAEEQEANRKSVIDYDNKKRAVDKASLETQSSILTRHQDAFDEKNINRMSSEFGSNKIEIYNEPDFVVEKVPVDTQYKIVGVRDIKDGKISIRDGDDITRLKHTSTHETMHDLSYQHENSQVQAFESDRGDMAIVSTKDLTSGIHKIEETFRVTDGTSDRLEIKHYNRYLNEGITEMYTLEEMHQRGEYPDFDSYTQEYGWAANLREIAGDEHVAKAYFGGDIKGLKRRVDDMGGRPGTWEALNHNIDAYRSTGDIRFKEAADEIIDRLHDAKEGLN